ncbi:MAG: S24 family peptidase, partial [Desulfohalobiaceae bacterium]
IKTMGSSLGGEIPDNALVLVDRAQKSIVAGSPYCIRIKGEIRIKRLEQDKETVLAYNNKGGQLDAEELSPGEDWEVIGRCVWYSKALN